MVTLGSKRIHIVFADSRGGSLQDKTDTLNKGPEHLEIMEYKGANLESLIESAERYLGTHPFDVIYISGGANNITTKNPQSKKISFNWGHGPQLMDHLTSILVNADLRFRKYFPAARIVFCPLVGSELARVVNAHTTSDMDQTTVDEAIWDFNSEVFRINKERGTYCPALQFQVHRYCKGKKRRYYEHLQDGLHPNEFLKEKWAQQFLKAMAHN